MMTFDYFPRPIKVVVGGQTVPALLEGYHQEPGRFYPTRTLACVTIAGQPPQLVPLAAIADDWGDHGSL